MSPRTIVSIAGAGALMLALAATFYAGRSSGAAAAERAAHAAWADAYRHQVRRSIAASAEIAEINRRHAAALAEARALRRDAVATVQEIVDAEPDWALVRADPDVLRVRDEQIAATHR